jgi:ABC-2 type transport system permease protein
MMNGMLAAKLKYWELVKNLAFVQLKLKYRGSILGFVWSLLNPLAMILVFLVAFQYIMRIGAGERNYLFFLVTGIIPWTFVANSLVGSASAIVSNGGLLKKVYFPREVFPLSVVLFHFIQFLLAQAVFVPFFFYWSVKGGTLGPVNLVYFLAMASLILFVSGLTVLVSSLTVLYRDIQHFTEIGVMMLFWLTPIIYPLEMIPEGMRVFFLVNPFTSYFHAFHAILYEGKTPEVSVVALVLVWPLIAFAAGWLAFRRIEPRFVDEL